MPQVRRIEMGDSYKSLAQEYYNNERHHGKIYEANKNRVGNPDQLQPGEHIVIPD